LKVYIIAFLVAAAGQREASGAISPEVKVGGLSPPPKKISKYNSKMKNLDS
jgi:hypothetical protein